MKISTKSVGKIKNSNSNAVGMLYQRQSTSLESTLTRTNSTSNIKHSSNMVRSASQKKCSSVGQIYTTKYSKSKQQANDGILLKRYGPSFINYDEIQNKLSNYLQCTINTNCRLKYNYLSQNQYPLTQNMNYNAQTMNGPLFFNRKMHTDQSKNDFNNRAEVRVTLNKQQRKQNLLHEKGQNNYKNKENINFLAMPRKQSIYGMASIDHEQNKSKLQNKLKKMIEDYENKQKQLSSQMKKIEEANKRLSEDKKDLSLIDKQINFHQKQMHQQNLVEINDALKEIFQKLIEFNLKSISLSPQIDAKLQQIWKSIHKQIVLDEQLRISKCYVNQQNIQPILNIINSNRIKKIELDLLKTHTDEYDPFLIQKANEFLSKKNIKLTDKIITKCIANIFVKNYEEAERHWSKVFSQEQMERFFRKMFLQKQINGLQKKEIKNNDLNLRDLARYLSTLFRANLRNRNIYQISKRLKETAFAGRFIELLSQKIEKGSQSKKSFLINK